ncbi:MAG TPA: RNA polymerase sigma factor [Candidatus Dormibacteraeota bacterium]|nr:RNA polymerase sigma factor [Candidatus Dormibacteraeota bacterium]
MRGVDGEARAPLGARADRERLSRLEPGSAEDFDVLYRLTFERIRQTCLVVLGGDPAAAEDCAQDAFVRAYRAWPRWRPEAPVEVWLHRIAVNVARTHKRRQMWRNLPLLGDRQARAQPLDETFVVMRALREMSVEDATALLLRYYHGYSGEEIAAGLGLPPSTVRGRIVRARTRLRQLLGDVPDGSSKPDVPGLGRME